MNRGQVTTKIVIVLTTVFAIVYDVWVNLSYGSEATISWVTWTTARKFPIIAVAVGILIGHLFWVQQTGMVQPRGILGERRARFAGWLAIAMVVWVIYCWCRH